MKLGSAEVEHLDTIVRRVAAADVGVPDVPRSDAFVDLAVDALRALDVGRAVSVAGGLLGFHQLVNQISISDIRKRSENIPV
jgi:hypothetical protein